MRAKLEMGDTRAVSPVFAYVLTLGIAAILITGLVVAAGTYVEDQRERTAQSELQVLGQQLSSDIATADRLNRTDGTSEVRISRTLPNTVVGSQYRVDVRDDGEGPTDTYLRLTATDIEVTVTVGLTTESDVVGSADGSTVVVEYDKTNEQLVVQNA